MFGAYRVTKDDKVTKTKKKSSYFLLFVLLH